MQSKTELKVKVTSTPGSLALAHSSYANAPLRVIHCRSTDTDTEPADWARRQHLDPEPPRGCGQEPGTYTTYCHRCQGVGILRIANLPWEACMECHGIGVVTVNGDREEDQRHNYTRYTRAHQENNAVLGAIALICVVVAALMLWAHFGNLF